MVKIGSRVQNNKDELKFLFMKDTKKNFNKDLGGFEIQSLMNTINGFIYFIPYILIIKYKIYMEFRILFLKKSKLWI